MLLVAVQSPQTQSAGNDINGAVSLQLQQRVELEEYGPPDYLSQKVSFTLKTIVFREGGITDGHFFVALQRAPNRWVIYNSSSTSGPYNLEQIQQWFGGKVYGVVYMRTEMPAEDDRQSLGEWLDDPAHADAVRMLASAVVNSGVEAPPAAAAAAAPAPSITSEQPPATSSPDSRLPIMWNATSTGFGANKSPPQDGDEPEPHRGSLFTRWTRDGVVFTQDGLPDAEAHIAGDGSLDLPNSHRDGSVGQADLLQRVHSSDALMPTQPASAGRLLSDELEAVPGEGHCTLPNSRRDGSVVQADLLQRTGMIWEDQAINVPYLDRAAEPLPQPNGDRPASSNAQAPAGAAVGMSRANSSDGPVSAQPASARPPLSDELETVDGQAHSEVALGQGTALHVAAEAAAQAFVVQPAPVEDVGAGIDPLVGQALTVTVVLPSLVALHVPVGCWAASVIGAAVCKKALSAWR
ncbi:hypothetical protein WJX82_007119 [Trebouxia sp. C0006]